MSTEHIVSQGGIVIYNPTAGRGRAGALRAQAQAMLGSQFQWQPTRKAGEAQELAKKAASIHEVIVAFGGDGTVGDVARGILEAKKETGQEATLGLLPVGTGNDFARNLGIPLRLETACETVNGGAVKRVDVGVLNGVPFINNAGTGFDAQVMVTMNNGIRFARGQAAFVAAILKTLPGFKPFQLTLTLDDGEPRRERAMMVSVLNGKAYGAGMLAAPFAEMDDGTLDILLIKAMSKVKLLPLVTKIKTGDHIGHPAVELLTARKLTLSAIPAQPLNMDGEVRGVTPMEISVEPRALKVLVR